MGKTKTALKLRVPKQGLYRLAVERIESVKPKDKKVIPFPKVFSKVGSSFQLNRGQCWELLYFLHDMGYIEIIAGHGVVVAEVYNG